MRRVLGFLLALTLLGVSACSSPVSAQTSGNGLLGNGWEPTRSLQLDYATNYSVEFFLDGGVACPLETDCTDDEYAYISISDGSRYLVTPDGMKAPEGIDPNIVVLERPLRNVYLAASATMSLVVALDALSHVRFSALQADGWQVPAAREAMENGQILFGGRYSAPDYEVILKESPSVAIENGMIYHSPEVKQKLETVGIPVLVEQSSYESHPLGRTEWIKLFGVLFGRESLAVELFDAQSAHLDALAGAENTGKTVAFFYISSAGNVVTRKSGDYVPKMIQLAGGKYVFDHLGDDKATSSVNLEMEQFYATAKDADFIIYNSTIGGNLTSLDHFLTMNPILKDFKAVQEGNVWCTDQDFYQDMTGLGQMISDMHEMLTDPTGTDQLTYLYRLT